MPVSFACDLKRKSADEMLAGMNERLRGSKLRLALVRVGAPGNKGAKASR